MTRAEKTTLAALRHEVPRRLILALLDRPGLAHKDLRARAGVAGSTLSFHLQRLVASGAIERNEEARYRVADPEAARRALVDHAESFDDPEVRAFVAGRARRLWGVNPPDPPLEQGTGIEPANFRSAV